MLYLYIFIILVLVIATVFFGLKERTRPLPSHEYFKTLLTFILIIAGGAILNYQFQKSSWNREASFELLKIELNDNKETINTLTYLIEDRFSNAQRVIWAVQSNDYDDFQKTWNDYMLSVNGWNRNVARYQSLVTRSFDRSLGEQLLTYTDDLNNEIPVSIHFKFYRIHEYILSLRNCFYGGCSRTNILDKLNVLQIDFIDAKFNFLERLDSSLLQKTKIYEK